MSTYRQIYYQLVFGTKYRRPTINCHHDVELYKYISAIIINKNCKPYCINGIEDHIHIMCDIHPMIRLADLVKDIKVASSLWMKECRKFPLFEGWQEGYGAFTYSIRERDKIINYIKRQKEHHQKENSIDEYRRILDEHGVVYEEKYLI